MTCVLTLIPARNRWLRSPRAVRVGVEHLVALPVQGSDTRRQSHTPSRRGAQYEGVRHWRAPLKSERFHWGTNATASISTIQSGSTRGATATCVLAG